MSVPEAQKKATNEYRLLKTVVAVIAIGVILPLRSLLSMTMNQDWGDSYIYPLASNTVLCSVVQGKLVNESTTCATDCVTNGPICYVVRKAACDSIGHAELQPFDCRGTRNPAISYSCQDAGTCERLMTAPPEVVVDTGPDRIWLGCWLVLWFAVWGLFAYKVKRTKQMSVAYSPIELFSWASLLSLIIYLDVFPSAARILTVLVFVYVLRIPLWFIALLLALLVFIGASGLTFSGGFILLFMFAVVIFLALVTYYQSRKRQTQATEPPSLKELRRTRISSWVAALIYQQLMLFSMFALMREVPSAIHVFTAFLVLAYLPVLIYKELIPLGKTLILVFALCSGYIFYVLYSIPTPGFVLAFCLHAAISWGIWYWISRQQKLEHGGA